MIETDPGYNVFSLHEAEVYLNGVKLDGCHTADESTGEAICYCQPLREHDRWTGTFATEIRRGNVEIRWPNRQAHAREFRGVSA